MGDRRKRERPARALGRIEALLSMHFIEPLGAIVKRRQRVVVDRPGRRDAVDVLDGAEVFRAQPIHHRAPELGVAADAVVGIRPEWLAAFVQPGFGGAVSEIFPDRGGIPVVIFLRDEIAALDDQDLRAGAGQLARHRAAAGAAANDDDIERVHYSGIRDQGSGIRDQGSDA